jgi:hypothetical protein
MQQKYHNRNSVAIKRLAVYLSPAAHSCHLTTGYNTLI